MGATAVILASAAVTTGLGAFSSFQQAKDQNEFAEAQALAQRRAQEANALQVHDQASIEKQKAINRHEQLVGRIRVRQTAAGVGIGGIGAALIRQADFDTSANIQIIEQNRENRLEAIFSGGQSFRPQNPIQNALLGGLSGLQTGLNLSSAIRDLN